MRFDPFNAIHLWALFEVDHSPSVLIILRTKRQKFTNKNQINGKLYKIFLLQKLILNNTVFHQLKVRGPRTAFQTYRSFQYIQKSLRFSKLELLRIIDSIRFNLRSFWKVVFSYLVGFMTATGISSSWSMNHR